MHVAGGRTPAVTAKPGSTRVRGRNLLKKFFKSVALDFLGFNPIKALVWSAIINGLLAPFLLVGIMVVAADNKLMKGQPSSRLSLGVVGLTALLMFMAAVAMFVL